jgi:hypothetical protein|tara:strand:- start:1611 stop:2006 length:396 start_codon:yes stop_codon:yes gene_type:complete
MRLAVALFFLATSVSAESSSLALQLPSPPMNYQSDRFRAGNLDCSNAVGGSTTLEFGTTGVLTNMNSVAEGKDIGIYARIVIPLDKPRTRINCDDLFQLELSQRRLEVQVLRAELDQMKRMQSNNSTDFEN